MRLHRRSLLAGASALLALPARGQTADDVRIAVISDLNGSYGSTDYGAEVISAVATIISLAPDMVICTGDMIAGQRRSPKFTEPELAAMWAAFHTVVTDPLQAAGIPLFVTPGNHDASDYPGFELERRVFDRVWTDKAPDAEILDGERFPFRYAAVCRGIFLIGLDVTRTGPLYVEETEWLKQVLIETRGRYRATIAFGHLPIWPVSVGRENDVIGDRAFEALLHEGGVGTYLSGHHHAFFPGLSGGLIQITQGCLGDGPRTLIGGSRRAAKSFTVISVDPQGKISWEEVMPAAGANSAVSETSGDAVERIGGLKRAPGQP